MTLNSTLRRARILTAVALLANLGVVIFFLPPFAPGWVASRLGGVLPLSTQVANAITPWGEFVVAAAVGPGLLAMLSLSRSRLRPYVFALPPLLSCAWLLFLLNGELAPSEYVIGLPNPIAVLVHGLTLPALLTVAALSVAWRLREADDTIGSLVVLLLPLVFVPQVYAAVSYVLQLGAIQGGFQQMPVGFTAFDLIDPCATALVFAFGIVCWRLIDRPVVPRGSNTHIQQTAAPGR